MASGDVVSDCDSVPLSSAIDFTPAAGVKILITGLAGSGGADCRFAILKGAVDATITNWSIRDTRDNKIAWFIDSTLSFRRQNDSGVGANPEAFSGVQL